ncbi:MAG: hypothetical protein ACYDEY_13940, partial [Acidimicrobiales bacterium]
SEGHTATMWGNPPEKPRQRARAQRPPSSPLARRSAPPVRDPLAGSIGASGRWAGACGATQDA